MGKKNNMVIQNLESKINKDGGSEEIARAFIELLKNYMTPSFGAMSKTLFEQHLLNTLRSLDVISQDPQPWELISSLKITRAKANNLLYGANLIKSDMNDEALDKELRSLLGRLTYIEDGTMVSLQVDNPLMRDHIKAKLRDSKHVSDGSFSAEIVRMKPKAFVDLYLSVQDEIMKRKIEEKANQIIKDKKKRDTFSGLFGLLSSIDSLSVAGIISAISGKMQELINADKDKKEEMLDSLFDAIKAIDSNKDETESK